MKETEVKVSVAPTAELTKALAGVQAAIMGVNNALAVPVALMRVQEPWFIDRMGEKVDPTRFAGDLHNHRGFYCVLQHRRGGHGTEGKGATLAEAINDAMDAVMLAVKDGHWNDSDLVMQEMGL